ncbi:MATE family efflux transporter [Pseudomonas sp. TTU2014-080ASC]|uniref:MATE family efflux transporter n=1 Tax=Pseudomonas sp. TTU2014-080ASC TaxID=1729724 RepID=UPI0007189112|nr:MATE family efflux transporter [Pseudomonas sp. TTU2014-080ASC]KRW57823.1 MATE family efflux transporter [Pseudomonas sp. TTU2014-080ASC]
MNALREAWQHAPTHRRVWALAAPMILSNLSVPMVALVDSAVIGRLPHAHQLAAVAVGGSLYTLLTWVVGFLRMGTTGFSAQAAGREDGSALRQVLVQGLLLGGLFAAVLILLAMLFSSSALSLMNPSADLDDQARTYLHIRLFGLPAALTTFALVGWLLGTQNSRGPLAILLTTNLINAGLDVLFVLGFNWGVAGAAWSSVIAEWSGMLLGLWLARRTLRNYSGALDATALKRWLNWRPLLSVNRDIFIRSLALQSVFFLVTVQGTRLGDATVAANALLLNGLMLTAYALDGLAHALEALCGHALGARDRAGLRRTLIVAGGWAVLASAVFALFFMFGGQWFIQMQTTMEDVRATAYTYLPYLAVLPLIGVWSYLLDGLFIGATRAREMRNAMVLALLLSLPLALVLQPLGNHGLWLAFLSFMALRSLTLGAYAYRLTRRDQWFAPAGTA